MLTLNKRKRAGHTMKQESTKKRNRSVYYADADNYFSIISLCPFTLYVSGMVWGPGMDKEEEAGKEEKREKEKRTRKELHFQSFLFVSQVALDPMFHDLT